LIAEGSSKLASVPSGGAGGAAASGGAATGGAAAAEEKVEEKEEGMLALRTILIYRHANSHGREGGIRRRHGIRSFRLSAPRHLLLQRSHTILGKWHKNGLQWSCMTLGVEGFVFDRSRGILNQLRYLEAVRANILSPASPESRTTIEIAV
jgi:large subunit ribosomal protein LP2